MRLPGGWLVWVKKEKVLYRSPNGQRSRATDFYIGAPGCWDAGMLYHRCRDAALASENCTALASENCTALASEALAEGAVREDLVPSWSSGSGLR